MLAEVGEESLPVDHGHRGYTEGEDSLHTVEEEAAEVFEAVDRAGDDINPRDENCRHNARYELKYWNVARDLSSIVLPCT